MVATGLIKVPMTTDEADEYNGRTVQGGIRLPVRTKFIRQFKTITSTVTLQVVGGDEKGRLEYETVKYGHEPHGTRTGK
jgi:hypothetical protein